ncbi:hypothetical protein ACFXDI_43895, partial [Streptomyces mirabilis]
ASDTQMSLARRYPRQPFFSDPSVWAAHVFIGAA